MEDENSNVMKFDESGSAIYDDVGSKMHLESSLNGLAVPKFGGDQR
jgi:hypothetical protein